MLKELKKEVREAEKARSLLIRFKKEMGDFATKPPMSQTRKTPMSGSYNEYRHVFRIL
jgi:hypothetical protein